MSNCNIKYIGSKDFKEDNVANTGLVWERGEIHPVPISTAKVLLRHPDVWALSSEESEGSRGDGGLSNISDTSQGRVSNIDNDDQGSDNDESNEVVQINLSAINDIGEITALAQRHFGKTINAKNLNSAKASLRKMLEAQKFED